MTQILLSEKEKRENDIIRDGARDGFKNITNVDYVPKRGWSPSTFPKEQLPDYLKYDPVLFQFFKRLHYEDKNFIAVVVGETGSGKSVTALNLARAIDITPLGNGRFKRNFIIKAQKNGKPSPDCRVVFGPSEFLRLIKSGLPKGSIIVWDEAGIGNDAQRWNDKKSLLIKHIMQTFRSRNYGIFMTVPDKESITLSTRRLVHCYIDVTRRDTTHAYLDIKWLNRVRGNEKTETYYKYPVFKDPISGKLKKIVKYKVPKIKEEIEKEYIKMKDATLQNMYEYYQKELEFMERELGEKNPNSSITAIKMKKFNMSACTDIAKNSMETLSSEDGSFTEAKIMLELSKNGYDCNKGQATLVKQMLEEYQSMSIT